FLFYPKKIFAYILSLTIIAGLVQQPDKIVVRYAHTIYPYSLGRVGMVYAVLTQHIGAVNVGLQKAVTQATVCFN
ncbi:MAG: hypothetical protein WC856_13570, partial [Methylococcaceae bacterium]